MKVLQINSVCGFGSTGRIATDIADILITGGDDCKKDFTVGITAGASTPDDIIEEVKVRVEKILL